MTQTGDPPNPPDPQQAPGPAYTPPPAYPPSQGGYPGYPAAVGYAEQRRGTPGMLIAVGVILLVLAVLALLWALLFVLYGALLGSVTNVIQSNPGQFNLNVTDVNGLMDSIRPILIGMAVFTLLVAIGHGAAGIGVLGRRGWARITGLVLGGLGLALNVIGLAVVLIGLADARPLTQNGLTIDPLPSLIVAIAVLGTFAVAYGFVVFALARRGADFR